MSSKILSSIISHTRSLSSLYCLLVVSIYAVITINKHSESKLHEFTKATVSSIGNIGYIKW